MTTIHEIQQVLWVSTPHGDGQALFLIDVGAHEDCVFLVALQETGEMKHYTARQVKICKNHTFDIGPQKERAAQDEPVYIYSPVYEPPATTCEVSSNPRNDPFSTTL